MKWEVAGGFSAENDMVCIMPEKEPFGCWIDPLELGQKMMVA